MIDPELLRKSGWSDDLIEAAKQVAEKLDQQMQAIGNTEIYIQGATVIEDSSTIDLSIESTPSSNWPTF